jgi:uncharacterized membrane protein YsdA (DUF1294 family)
MDFPRVLVIICTGLNVLAFVVFSHDKIRAKMRTGRSSEDLLLLAGALGPFGALTAMVVFRHKTRHTKFLLVPVFAMVDLLLIVWFWPFITG